MYLILALALVIPSHTGYVTDQAKMLTSVDRTALEQQLREYERTTTREVAVLIINSLDGNAIEDYANQTFHAWGIGKSQQDNGVLFLWAVTDRKVRIEVGYGLEPVLPDGRAGQIIREQILPAFRDKHWHDGVFNGVNAILAQLNREPTAPLAAVAAVSLWWPVGMVICVVLIILVIALIISANRTERRVAAVRDTDWRDRAVGTTRRSSSSSNGGFYADSDVASSTRSRRDDESESSSASSSWGSSGSSFGGDSGGSFGGGDSGGGGASGSY